VSENEDDNAAIRGRTAHHLVEAEDEGERADVVLGRRVPALSRRLARTLAREGKLRIDGRRQPPSTRVHAGQRLEIELERPQDRRAPALDELEILATTADFVYVAKPAGVHTVALTPAQPGVLATAVAARFPECGEASEDPREGGAVHRLDRPTSGVVAFARSRAVWREARAGFRDERVAKHYLAVCAHAGAEGAAIEWPPPLPEGGLRGWIEALPSPEAWAGLEPTQLAELLDPLLARGETLELECVRIRAALGRDGPKRSAVRLDGRRASTVVQPLARTTTRPERWLVRLLLETGRRHQARVHLAWVGLPIAKDSSYGPTSQSRPPRAIHLHAFAINLHAVFPGERAVFAPPPPGFWPPAADED
jgi:23S rRNA pseudouridine1911/1915/1917 synthase